VDGGGNAARFNDPKAAIEGAAPESAVLILSDGYPTEPTRITPEIYHEAAQKKLRLYVEYPAAVPGVELGERQKALWERLVINDPEFGNKLPVMSIASAHACSYIPVETSSSLIAIGRVAGFDRALFGLPGNAVPALFREPKSGWLIATTGLSHFRKGRFAPSADWTSIWNGIFAVLNPDHKSINLKWEPVVSPSYSQNEPLPVDAQVKAIRRLANWYSASDMLPDRDGEEAARTLITDTSGTAPLGAISTGGEGKFGILEGYESLIQPDGKQNILAPLRADCISESAMALAFASLVTSETTPLSISTNLMTYLYDTAEFTKGDRGITTSPAYGLIAWGIGAFAWEKANYGDDNARTILATIATASIANNHHWNDKILRAILANFRTTGKAGFRGDRIDMPELMANGWRHYFNAEPRSYSPHFESYLWACYIWAYHQTGYRPLLEKARNGIAETMQAFPDRWRRNDMMERGRMLLPLAWLIRVEDTPETRGWLNLIADDILNDQHESGALPERENGGTGHYQVPHSNEEYGTSETPLIQKTGDKATDQLYTAGFALIGLHEAATATNDPKLKAAEEKLAEYLVRIQTRSNEPWLDGVWFRAFDYGRWDYWASSADAGWGAWVIETGWGQAWIAATLALREQRTSLWDMANQIELKPISKRIIEELELPD